MHTERRRAGLTVAGIGLVLSLLCGWLVASSIAASLVGFREGAAEVRVSGGDIAMLALMPIFIGLTLWGLLAVFREGARVRRIGNGIAVAAMIAVPLALGGSWAFQVWAERQLVAQGYVRCGAERVGRFPLMTMCLRKSASARP